MDRREFLSRLLTGTAAATCGMGVLAACESDSSARSGSDTEASSSGQTTGGPSKSSSGRTRYDASTVSTECDPPEPTGDYPAVGETVDLSEEEWRSRLSDKEYRILRESGTEMRGSGELLNNKKRGIYHCAGCGAPLFSSCAKYDSKTGWPSFWRPYDEKRIKLVADKSMGMTRTEVVCANCDGHQGHVFDDGPPPTGKRYCINSASLTFRPAESAGVIMPSQTEKQE